MASKYKFIILEIDETGDEHVFMKDKFDIECEGFALLTMRGDPDDPEKIAGSNLLHNVSLLDLVDMLDSNENIAKAAKLLTLMKALDRKKKGDIEDAAD